MSRMKSKVAFTAFVLPAAKLTTMRTGRSG
jgi:hypothetical protein